LIRVVVADARGSERLRCRQELHFGTGCTVVAEAVTAGQAVAVAAFELPDVVIVGPDLPNDEGVELLADLGARVPNAAVLALGSLDGLAAAVQRTVLRRPSSSVGF
jgi:DNA-binding NarL/FixJ family response regulator